MTADLIARLRGAEVYYCSSPVAAILAEATDRIEELEAEVERLSKIQSALVSEQTVIAVERALADQAADCVRQFADVDSWTHDGVFMYQVEAAAFLAAWEAARHE